MANYTAQPGDVIAPGLQGAGGNQGAVTELFTRVGGKIAACGEAALAVILGWTQGRLYTSDQVAALVQDAITHGASPKGGTSTPKELAATAQDYGVTLQNIPWTTALKTYAGQVPILLNIQNATALGGADVGVGGHYVTVVGKTHNGNYILADPNQPASKAGKYTTATPAQIANAQPYSAQIVKGGTAAMAQSTGDVSIPGISGLIDAVNNLTKSFQGAATFSNDWLANPWRIVKLVTGLGIIGLTLWAALNIRSVQVATQVAEGVAGAGNPVNRFSRIGGTARGLGARPPQVFPPGNRIATQGAAPAPAQGGQGAMAQGVQVPVRRGPGGPPPAAPQPIPRIG